MTTAPDPLAGLAAEGWPEAVRRLRRAFAEAGLDSPGLEARLIAGAVLGGASSSARVPDRTPSPGEAASLRVLAARRLAREPLARILGEREFWSLPFRLSPDTLEPRPDSETIVEAALRAAPDPSGTYRVLDLGTGSGCLLVAVLHERPRAFGVGTDRSEGALRTARANAVANGVADRAGFVGGHWARALAGPFDLVLANPPYIARGVLPTLAPEVLGHDPRLALDGGPDGLDAYREIVPALPGLLGPDGTAILEIGFDQAEAVAVLAEGSGLRAGEAERDLAGRPRAVLLRPGG